MKVFVVMSHTLIDEQMEELESHFDPAAIVYLPDKLKEQWKNIPANGPWQEEWIIDILNWLEKHGKDGDIAIVQGEYGATFYLVNWLKQRGITPYYATTERQALETKNADGSVEIKRVFRHVNFRAYP